jgi:hypothetical protein
MAKVIEKFGATHTFTNWKRYLCVKLNIVSKNLAVKKDKSSSLIIK